LFIPFSPFDKVLFLQHGLCHAGYIGHGDKDCQMKTKDGCPEALTQTIILQWRQWVLHTINLFYIGLYYFTFAYEI